MIVTDLSIIQIADRYPVRAEDLGTRTVLERRHLWMRSPRQQATLRIRAGLIRFIREFFDARGFVCCDAPVLISYDDTETASSIETDYFGDRACLARSGRLYNEAAAAVFRKVYSFGPTFGRITRGTRSNLVERWMVEPEVAFADLDDIMHLAEELVVSIVGRAVEDHRSLLVDTLERDLSVLDGIQTPFPRIPFDQAAERLVSGGFDPTEVGALGHAEQAHLAAGFDRPVFVHHFPVSWGDFSTAPDPENPGRCLSMDLLAPGEIGRIISGGQRIHDREMLERRIAERKIPRKGLQWYVDLRRYGTFQHAGFSLVLERMVAFICGAEHPYEAVPFPRMLDRLTP